MKLITATFIASALWAGVAIPAHAQSLLGIVGERDSGALVTIGGGDADDSGLANVGLGGDDQVVDVRVGRDVGRVSVGSDGADVSVLGGAVNASVGVGGSSGSGGGGGGAGAGGGGNGGGSGSGGGLGGIANSGGNGSNVCVGLSADEIERLVAATRLDGSWQRASNIAIQPVALCPAQREQLAAALVSSGIGSRIAAAIAADPMVSASIQRSSYRIDRVFAVHRSGEQLTVYVY